MRRRCNDLQNNRYQHYGAKGITYCERWRFYKNFLEDMGERPEGCTLGRHGDQGNYEPGNVSWQTTSGQARRGEANHVAKLTQECRLHEIAAPAACQTAATAETCRVSLAFQKARLPLSSTTGATSDGLSA